MPFSLSLLLLMKSHLKYLHRSWDIIAGQDYEGPVEYVYIDSGSTDGTIEFMRARGIEAHHIPPSEFHHGRTRNLAASLARNEILVCLSADAIPLDNQWLRHLVEPFEDARVGATYGRQVAGPEIGAVRRFGMEWEYPLVRQVRDLSETREIHLGLFRMSNANSAIRAEVWRRFKFNETVVTTEDMGLCRDILTNGMKVVYVPEAAVCHCHEKSLWCEFQNAFDSGISLKRLGILDNPQYGNEARYGLTRVKKEWQYFTSRGEYVNALKGLATSTVKWLGVQVGKRGNSLPLWLTRRISAGIEKMHD
jgi:rhamnosyltransferase